MSRSGLVTVILPNRNHGHFLPRALDALLAQTWKDLEILVIDDASSDNSLEIIAGYTDHDARVRSIFLEEHHGINKAVSVAIKLAEGEFIYAAAADDFVEPCFIERCITEMNKYPSVGLSFSDPTEFHQKDQRKINFPLYLANKPTYFDPQLTVELLRKNYFHISPNTGIFRSCAFREAGGFAPELHWFSDWFVVQVIALRHGVCYLPEQLTYVTIRDDSYSAKNVREAGRQRWALLGSTLNRLTKTEYADVAPLFREAALIPEYRLKTLFWLLGNTDGRKLLTYRLVGRIIVRGLWHYLRPLALVDLRKKMRLFQSQRSRSF